jgi:uncharacterized flavoprotein (TIGR03862 family)
MNQHLTIEIVVIGAGPAGLAAAEAASRAGHQVLVIDATRGPGRKWLLAGRSGLNLTNAEPIDPFVNRYSGSAGPFVAHAVRRFPPMEMRRWAAALGEPTTTGSGQRVFPRSHRGAPLLRRWLQTLVEHDVVFEHEWVCVALEPDPAGNGDDRLTTEQDHRWLVRCHGTGRRVGSTFMVSACAVVLAMGGASWPRTGSTGEWKAWMERFDRPVVPFQPSNASLVVPWSDRFIAAADGMVLKGVTVRCGTHHAHGDVLVTQRGLEGGPVYSVSPGVREGHPLSVDLRPDALRESFRNSFRTTRGRDSLSNRLRKAGLNKAALLLLNECGLRDVRGDAPLDLDAIAELVNNVPIRGAQLGPIDRAISTAGGIAGQAIDESGMLIGRPGVFVAGEMIDWDAPTGGYLLQGCWSTGFLVGGAAARYVRQP